MLSEDLNTLQTAALPKISAAADIDSLEELRVSLLGKSGAITGLMKTLGSLEPEARKARGAELNVLKQNISEALSARRAVLDDAALTARLAAQKIDISAPPRPEPVGAIHPISRDAGGNHRDFRRSGFRHQGRPGYRG